MAKLNRTQWALIWILLLVLCLSSYPFFAIVLYMEVVPAILVSSLICACAVITTLIFYAQTNEIKLPHMPIKITRKAISTIIVCLICSIAVGVGIQIGKYHIIKYAQLQSEQKEKIAINLTYSKKYAEKHLDFIFEIGEGIKIPADLFLLGDKPFLRFKIKNNAKWPIECVYIGLKIISNDDITACDTFGIDKNIYPFEVSDIHRQLKKRKEFEKYDTCVIYPVGAKIDRQFIRSISKEKIRELLN